METRRESRTEPRTDSGTEPGTETGSAPRPKAGAAQRIETRSVHAGRADNRVGAVAPPIHLSTTFERRPEGDLVSEFLYSRSGNPDRTALEETIRDLEGGADCVAFSSGLAALHSLFLALEPGDLALAPGDAYHGTQHLLRGPLARWGLRTRFTDFLDPEDFEAGLAMRPALVLVETPSNPTLRVTDIAAAAKAAHEAGALLAVDNTWLTPVLQRPLELGADLVAHASTKYFGGHSDATGGAVVVREGLALAERLRSIQADTGPVPSPFDAWLLRRGIRTLPVRIRAQSANAGAVAAFLDSHPAVAQVFYPGLAADPGHEAQTRQADGYGAMLSFRTAGGEAAARRALARVSLATRATSLGGVETLIEHRAAVEGPETRTPRDLLRMSVGLEHPDDLIADLDRALDSG